MSKPTSKKRGVSVAQNTRKTAPKRAPAQAASPKKQPSRPELEPPARGISLALLKDFYWIELGIRSYLSACNNPDFSRSEGMVIANILLGHKRPSDIARQLGISRQAIHVTIQQMREKGILDLVADPHDGRINQVVMTDLGKKMNDDGVVAMGILWEELAQRLGRERLSKAAEVFEADWGAPIMFDAGENGPEWRRR